MKKTIFISGASGFIGRKLAWELADRGHTVHALCRNPQHPYLIKHSNIRTFAGDILDKQSLAEAMSGCDQVYHTAALAKMWCRDRNDFHRVNVEGTQMVMETAIKSGVKKVVYTSSCGVIGPTVRYPMHENSPRILGFPIDYERTKYLAELEVKKYQDHGLNAVIVNPSRVFGEGPVTGSNTVAKMVAGYLRGSWRIIPGSGDNVANYAFLDDVVLGHINAMDLGRPGERYILGGEDISFNQFFEILYKVSGIRRRLFRIPQKAIEIYSELDWFRARITRTTPVLLPEFARRLKADQKYTSAKAMNELNYKITPFHQALRRTMNYLQSH